MILLLFSPIVILLRISTLDPISSHLNAVCLSNFIIESRCLANPKQQAKLKKKKEKKKEKNQTGENKRQRKKSMKQPV